MRREAAAGNGEIAIPSAGAGGAAGGGRGGGGGGGETVGDSSRKMRRAKQ